MGSPYSPKERGVNLRSIPTDAEPIKNIKMSSSKSESVQQMLLKLTQDYEKNHKDMIRKIGDLSGKVTCLQEELTRVNEIVEKTHITVENLVERGSYNSSIGAVIDDQDKDFKGAVSLNDFKNHLYRSLHGDTLEALLHKHFGSFTVLRQRFISPLIKFFESRGVSFANEKFISIGNSENVSDNSQKLMNANTDENDPEIQSIINLIVDEYNPFFDGILERKKKNGPVQQNKRNELTTFLSKCVHAVGFDIYSNYPKTKMKPKEGKTNGEDCVIGFSSNEIHGLQLNHILEHLFGGLEHICFYGFEINFSALKQG